jgi:pimeloyl-ACP methyl ester carboxylesterase
MTTADDPTTGNTIRLSDGRILGYAEYGLPDGTPVIGFHGMPGSRLMLKVLEPAAISAGARLITPDRPGYGRSQPNPRGTLREYPQDIAELADALRLERFAVVGVSGGGPYALACAHELPERLSLAGLVSGVGPLAIPGGLQGMARMNRIMFTLGRYSPALTGKLLPRLMRSSWASLEEHVRNGTSPTPDISPEQFAVITADQREALRSGGQGIAFDMRALWRGWSFRLEDIRAQVCLWHGEADELGPVRLVRYIAQRVPGCEATYYPGEGHVGPLTLHGEEIMKRIVSAR